MQNCVNALVIDANDFMSRTAVVRELCNRAGLNPDYVIDQWPKATEEELRAMPPAVAQIKKDVLNSEGLIPRSNMHSMVAEKEEEEWKNEFGEEAAALINDLVARTMPDYEHLQSKVITVASTQHG